MLRADHASWGLGSETQDCWGINFRWRFTLFPLLSLYNDYSCQMHWKKGNKPKLCAAQGWDSPFEWEVLALPMLFLAVMLTEPRGWSSCMQGPAQSCLLPLFLQFLSALDQGENAKTAPRGGSDILGQNGSWSHLQHFLSAPQIPVRSGAETGSSGREGLLEPNC